jgi:outer membrane protein insertion porin family
MRLLTTIFFCSIFFCSCSVKRFLPPGEKLYKGASIKVEKHPETKDSEKSLKKLLKLAAKPAPNKYFLGQPYKVWFWYVIGEPKREKGFRAFLRKRLAEEPVFASRVNAAGTASNMQVFMSNIGYFHTTVQGDTSNQGYFSKAIYTAQVQPRYTLQ